MTLVRIEPGVAVLSMPVSQAMVNGHGLAHGGFIFTLADSAFAFACNSRNQRCVAQNCQIAPVSRRPASWESRVESLESRVES